MTRSALCGPEEFRSALAKGLGRAVGHVRAAPAELVREPLLHACTHYLGYDLQCEDSRAPWLHEMVQLTGEPDWYCTEALQALTELPEAPEDPRSLFELTGLLILFARDGHPEIREPLLRKIFSFSTDIVFTDLPAELFGIAGFTEMAVRYGRMEDREYAVGLGRCLLEDGEKHWGPLLANALRRRARTDASLSLFLYEMDESRRKEEKERRNGNAPPVPPSPHPVSSLDELFSRLASLSPIRQWSWEDEAYAECQILRGRFRRAASLPNGRKAAPPEFFEQVLARLLTESRPERRFCLLAAFARMPLPRFEPAVLRLVDSPFSQLGAAAARALSRLPHPKIRAKGRRLLAAVHEGANWEHGFWLLSGSGCSEDWPLVCAALSAIPAGAMDPFDLHNLVGEVEELQRMGGPGEAAPAMLWIYENSPCANCRGDSVSWLIENRAAPAELLEECLDDCDEHIRGLAADAMK